MRRMCPSAYSTMASRLRFVSAKVAPAGAMSASWKQKKGTPSLEMNSNAASIFSRAAAMGFMPASSQGLSRVPGPNMSWPDAAKECQ